LNCRNLTLARHHPTREKKIRMLLPVEKRAARRYPQPGPSRQRGAAGGKKKRGAKYSKSRHARGWKGKDRAPEYGGRKVRNFQDVESQRGEKRSGGTLACE